MLLSLCPDFRADYNSVLVIRLARMDFEPENGINLNGKDSFSFLLAAVKPSIK